MRSFVFTLILALTALIFCGLAGWQWQTGNFDTVLGARPTPVGQRLYNDFKPEEVREIQIYTSSTSATFVRSPDGWRAIKPWQDRMDPRAAVSIINFTLGLRVEDTSRVVKLEPRKVGIDDGGAIQIRLEEAGHKPLAKYKLGRIAPWKAEVEGMEQPVTTVFVQPRDKGRKDHVFLCTGDISPLLKDGLKYLRDHHPFYFNPITLSKVRIRSQQGDLTLGRATLQSPWRIVKPLDLPTDPKAIKALLEGIFQLQAVKVSDRAAVTLPATDGTLKTGQIALASFGSETETTLDIFPPESPESNDVKAIVSDRPGAVFDLPAKPEPGLVSLADLPLSVNELRDPTLTRLNIQGLRAIAIQPATGAEIIISRDPQQPWTASSDGRTFEANEENLYSLLKAVTTTRAIGFESDAATDFTPWGLDRPFLALRFLAQDNQALELRFGLDTRGSYFVNRLGTPTVMRVDSSLIQAIAVRPYEWHHARVWSLDRTNLTSIVRQTGAENPLILKYSYLDEKWRAERGGKDLSAQLDPTHANFMLSNLEGLKASRWLATDDAGALTTLATPSLTFTVFEKTVDEDGNDSGVSMRSVSLAPAAPGNNPGFYYGRLNTETHPFLLDSETYRKIALDLFGNGPSASP